MIPKEVIAQILDATRIEEVVGDFVQLKRSGSSLKGLSPFSNEKTPSFYVSPAKGIFKDFSSGKGGSAVTFLMEHEKLSYPEALRYLARKYNIEISEEELTAEQVQEQNERESLLLILKFAQEYFSDILHHDDEGMSVGLSYFRERGFSDPIIKKFQLGYHPEGRDKFTRHALEKGYRQEYLEKLGLTRSRDGKLFDFFHGRVMFPIHNLTGRVIGFGGRILRSDKNTAKYFNSPESELYNKSRTLYGIFQAKNKIVGEDNCYLVEGYTDVLSLHQAGIENTVASSGTSLTVEQIQLIKRYTPNVTILYDGDAAGIRASFRGIDMVLEAGLNVKVVLFPDGDDPDSYSRKVSTEELKNYLQTAARDFITFKTGLLLSDAGTDPIKRAAIIQDIVSSVALVPDAIMRSTYLRATSQMMDISEQVLINELNKIRRNRDRDEARKAGDFQEIPLPPPIPAPEPPSEVLNVEHQEKELIRILLLYGHLDFDFTHRESDGTPPVIIKQNVADFIIETIISDEIYFENPLYLEMFRLLQNDYKENPQRLIYHEDPAIAGVAANLSTSPYQLSENWEKRHFVITPTEEKLLEKAVKSSLYDYLLKRVDLTIHGILQKLRESREDNEEFHALMNEQMQYIEAKKVLSGELNRVIIR